ncbi:hypothetical protein A2311_05290 [candidate division WOR-1 bacterium RIFOXYB2_FULL_48_7]|uniref:Glycosyltransferase RgtA/B/C/D-like domain-containing protein n=1 Tax=candidate division WOR-1 bacterium RIFOXYB2_FULL_48_7 TaxID=1802583 RepID=A0A1F4TI35_UNCSA|nr:MAG: hypothetical protein A2311_05290 [candidate division WOR-1 bacterium RIFOXYB2_FULL_48_7]
MLIIGLPAIYGSIWLSLILGNEKAQFSWPEKGALSIGLGLGLIILTMFSLDLLHQALTFSSIIFGLSLVSFPALIYLIKQKNYCFSLKEFLPPWPKLANYEWLIIFLISLKSTFVLFSALVKPVVDCDAFQFYAIVAKGIFFDHSFSLPHLQQYIGDKPLLPFLAQGWTFLAQNSTNDSYLKLIPAVMFICLIIVFYAVARRLAAMPIALLFAWMLSTLPFFVYHATTAYADLAISFFYVIGTFYLCLLIREISAKKSAVSFAYILLSAIFLGLTVWAKRAGLVLAGIDLFILLAVVIHYREILVKQDYWRLATGLLVFLLIVLPWLMLGQLGTLTQITKSMITAPAIVQGSTAINPDNGRFLAMISIFGRKLFLYNDWQLAWAGLIIVFAFFWRQILKPPYSFILLIIIIDLLSLFVQFGSGETFRWLLDGTLLDRLLLNQVPIVLFYCLLVIFDSKDSWAENKNRVV